MFKRSGNLILPLFFLAVLCLFINNVEGKVGLGVSDFEANVSLKIGETEMVQVAKLWNTGDVVLNVTAKWMPKNQESNLSLFVEAMPLFKVLQPDESYTATVEVTGFQEGNFSGKIEFTSVILENPTHGNPIGPGGGARISVVVEGSEVVAPFASDLPLMIGAGVTLVAAGVVAVKYMEYRRKRVGTTK